MMTLIFRYVVYGFAYFAICGCQRQTEEKRFVCILYSKISRTQAEDTAGINAVGGILIDLGQKRSTDFLLKGCFK